MRRVPPRLIQIASVAAVVILLFARSARCEDDLAAAGRLLLTGKYAEAEAAYEKLKQKQPARAAIGVACCRFETGELEKARSGLEAALADHPQSADITAELARLALVRGDYQGAEELADKAIKIDRDQLLARFVLAETQRATGKLAEADRSYRWFVDYYNDHEDHSAEQLRWIALGATTYARWNHLSDQFTFLVNELLPEALKQDESFWPAHYESGRLLLSKYNQTDAADAFKAALTINPRAAAVYAAVGELALLSFETNEAKTAADRALEINPKLLEAHHLQADIHFCNVEPDRAAEVLRLALLQNPNSPATLGRLAAAYASIDGFRGKDPGPRANEIIRRIEKQNPHAGDFYFAMADALDKLRRFPAAERYYAEAAKRMPQLDTVLGQLGMMQMRLGDEGPAKKILTDSFEADPFNIRVSNTLEVLEVLEQYATRETPHFIIKYDPKKDRILAEYVANFLEEIYPQLCKQFAFEPQQKSLFEIFNEARGTDGHGWFSARMVGLPHVHTIGACAGKMVAMQSPVGGSKPFNWARVMKHEFVHVLNLQQTDFNIPHWYTEALAVLNEGYPRSQDWNRVLIEAAQKHKLFNLDTINFGFIRPHNSDQWTLAYCQAELYAEYMLKRFGESALAKLLAAYSQNLSTPRAIEQAFGVSKADFERGYREYLEAIMAEAQTGRSSPARTLPEIQAALKKDPANADLLAELGQAELNRKRYAAARKRADEALKASPRHQLASYVKARVLLVVGDDAEALELLETALNEKAPQENLLALLAAFRLKAEKYADAAHLYELGLKNAPHNANWLKSLGRVYLASGDEAKLADVLEKLAPQDPDDVAIRKKLAELRLAAKDFPGAVRWAREALQIDVADLQIHKCLAQALVGSDQPAAAAQEYLVAVELAPAELGLRLELAKAFDKAKQPQKARAALSDLLKLDSKFPGAQSLLESLK